MDRPGPNIPRLHGAWIDGSVNIDRLSNEEGCAQQVEQELSRIDLGRYKPLWTE